MYHTCIPKINIQGGKKNGNYYGNYCWWNYRLASSADDE